MRKKGPNHIINLMRHIKFTAVLLVLFFLSAAAQAQLVNEISSVTLAADPSSPSPGAKVTIAAATPTFDKNAAVFDWVIDGKPRPELSGQGQNIITLTAGALGSSIRINVAVSGPSGSAKASLTIRVSDLALVWFAETYVPKWYRGKALPVPNSIVSVVALPNLIFGGERLRPEELVYRWSLNDEENIRSGAGEQVFRVKMSDLPESSQRIRVVVEDPEKRIHREGEVFLLPTKPRAVVYPATPLGGVETRSTFAFLGATLKSALLDFQVEPFFFPVSSRRDLSYRWSVAGTDVAGGAENPFILTLDLSGQPSGEIPISAKVDDSDFMIPSASGFINITVP